MNLSLCTNAGVHECLFLYFLKFNSFDLSLYPSRWLGISASTLFSYGAWKMGKDLSVPVQCGHHRPPTGQSA